MPPYFSNIDFKDLVFFNPLQTDEIIKFSLKISTKLAPLPSEIVNYEIEAHMTTFNFDCWLATMSKRYVHPDFLVYREVKMRVDYDKTIQICPADHTIIATNADNCNVEQTIEYMGQVGIDLD